MEPTLGLEVWEKAFDDGPFPELGDLQTGRRHRFFFFP